MWGRLGAVLVAALVAAGLSLPVRVGPARPAPAPVAPLEADEFRVPGSDLRDGEPGSFRVIRTAPPPPQTPVADLIFLHGHADRVDNHRELFARWAQAGIAVVAPDLPSHGDTSVRGIDAWTTGDIAALVGLLERRYGATGRPLILAGWSYGGLMATRILQSPDHLRALARRPAAVVLLVPAVAPLPLTGGDGISRHRSLRHDPDPEAAPPSPASPLLNPVFAVRLLAEAWAARHDRLPAEVPAFVVASDAAEDRYVDADGLLRWASAQGAQVLSCTGARHAVDLEPWPTGPTVRQATVGFLASAVPGVRSEPDTVDPPVTDQEQTCRMR
jgi:alpha-beta hydrolase superfamily lysophospholipase